MGRILMFCGMSRDEELKKLWGKVNRCRIYHKLQSNQSEFLFCNMLVYLRGVPTKLITPLLSYILVWTQQIPSWFYYPCKPQEDIHILTLITGPKNNHVKQILGLFWPLESWGHVWPHHNLWGVWVHWHAGWYKTSTYSHTKYSRYIIRDIGYTDYIKISPRIPKSSIILKSCWYINDKIALVSSKVNQFW